MATGAQSSLSTAAVSKGTRRATTVSKPSTTTPAAATMAISTRGAGGEPGQQNGKAAAHRAGERHDAQHLPRMKTGPDEPV
jgi:hypothetical protein